MLGQIVFLIMDETQVESAVRLKQIMGDDGNRIHIWGSGSGDEGESGRDERKRTVNAVGEVAEDKHEGDTEIALCMEKRDTQEGEKEPKCLQDYDIKTTLFVTDEALILQELRRQGRYVIAFLHDNNGSKDWSGAAYMIADIEELEMDSFEKAYQRMVGEPWTVLETERCMIRETTVEDVEEFYRIYAEPSITYFMDPLYEKPEEERAYAQDYIEKVYSFYGYGMWSIVNQATGRVMGRAGLSWREGYDIPELGFVIEVPYQRQGYAFEVCRAIVDYGFHELDFEKIQALVKAENVASVMLCKKLGFECCGEVEEQGEEYERYVLYKDSINERPLAKIKP